MNRRRKLLFLLEAGVKVRLGSEIAINGGFETLGGGGTDVFAGWYEFAGSGAISAETSFFYRGERAVKLVGAGSTGNPSIFQDISGVVPGSIYRFSFFAAGDGTNAGRYQVRNQTASSDIISVRTTGLPVMSYQKKTIDLTIPAGCTTIRILFSSALVSGAICYFDNASVKPVNP